LYQEDRKIALTASYIWHCHFDTKPKDTKQNFATELIQFTLIQFNRTNKAIAPAFILIKHVKCESILNYYKRIHVSDLHVRSVYMDQFNTDIW